MIQKTPCIAVDVDGTLAVRGDRDPYDMTRVGEDTVNEPVAFVVRHLVSSFSRISIVSMRPQLIITSGRTEDARRQTEMWLDAAGIRFAWLLMRANGDGRSDDVVKAEMLEKIQERFDIICVFDDRDRVVKMWRDNGITCFQVAPGDF